MTNKEIYWSYIKKFIITIFLIAITYPVVSFVNKYHLCSQDTINWIGVLGVICDATAIYGIADIQTWSGKSPSEKLNLRLGFGFLFFGLTCTALTYLLRPA